jgi:hypothetical protein
MLAVALNGDNRLTIVGRDVANGNMTSILSSLEIDVGGRGPGMVTCAVWDEDDGNQASSGNSSAVSSASVLPSKTGMSSGNPAYPSGSVSATPIIPGLSAGEGILSELSGVATSMAALLGDLISVTAGNPASATAAEGAILDQ